jgi:hypothetical protein
MKLKLYSQISIVLALFFLGTTTAQKVAEKFTENFKVNKDVSVNINATNTEINVSTWNKNEVQVEAFIEIEGLSKTAAEEYIKKWNFEALGNKSKVKIISKALNSTDFEDNFIFFNESNFRFPEIKAIDFDSLMFPEKLGLDVLKNIDFEKTLSDFDIDKLMEETGDYDFKWKSSIRNIVIKSKKEWEAFKKTKEYKEFKEELKINKETFKKKWEKSKKDFKKIDRKLIKKELEKAKLEFSKIDTKKIKAELAEATEELKKLKFIFFSDSKESDLKINGKKVKIKKRLEIKVPKATTFDLNTRHCKVDLPNTLASGNVKYGTFTANNLLGGNLTIAYAQVLINDLNTCKLFLNNVTNAKITSVKNTTLSNPARVAKKRAVLKLVMVFPLPVVCQTKPPCGIRSLLSKPKAAASTA